MENLLIVALACMVTALPFWLGGRYGAVPLVSPMHLLSYFCAFGFLVKAVVYAFAPEWSFYSRFIDTPGADLKGALYLGTFILLMCAGYRVGVHASDRPAAVREIRLIASGLQRHNWLFAASFMIAGLTLVLMLRARGVSGISADLLETLNTDKQINVDAAGNGATLAGIKTLFIVPKCAFVLLFANGIVLRNAMVLAQSALIAALVVCIALVSGDRFELVELFAFGAITYLLVGGPVRLRSLFVAFIAATTVLLFSAYMTALRGNDAGLLHQVVGSTYFLDFNAAVMVTDRVAPQMYLWGGSYTWWGFGWFPRAFWPDKPAIDLGVFFKREVMGLMTGGAFNVTGPGEAYINFGPAGAVVGFALGWVYRRAEIAVLCAQNTLRFASFALYPLLFYPFVQGTLQSSFSAFIVGAVAQLALIVCVIVLCLPRYRPRAKTQIAKWGKSHAV
ncbi:oligosaccharide repeat unit polymerase [Yoonia sp.]|uniref:oligosaccharide repeat unit polymerase n=1 Tax=Yoonia sp. TaxID=2212373 RepID=UPI0025CF7758|nr:oligosaccharide repeat unit polymerase [Yoonia sp.]